MKSGPIITIIRTLSLQTRMTMVFVKGHS